MKAEKKKKYYQQLRQFISVFEKNIDKNRKKKSKKSGDVYTPKQLTTNIIEHLFRIILSDFGKEAVKYFFEQEGEIEETQTQIISRFLKNLKILDPACGSGRWLVSVSRVLFKLNLMLSSSAIDQLALKKKIIKRNIYGNDIEKSACTISKLNLLLWIYKNEKNHLQLDSLQKPLNFEQIDKILELNQKSDLNFNITNHDFLLNFSSQKFHLILGNPPYIENKSIAMDYKKQLYQKFHSAYKLFDLSILFIEQAVKHLKPEGIISFLITNKFLSADYGIKIRNLMLKKTTIREIIDVSSLDVFKKAATYPIIITLQKSEPKDIKSNKIGIKRCNNLKKFRNDTFEETEYFQRIIHQFPSHVIPTSKHISIVSEVYKKYDPIDSIFDDLKIIYRPFGFTKWKKHFEDITDNKSNNKDLLLIGTGNLSPYVIKYEKKIRIAGYNLPISYCNLHEHFSEKFEILSQEKLIFREIAKRLTFVYDPGIFMNITGLYFLQIPPLDSADLFALLTIFNSKLLNLVFNTLFSSLHMSGGYLRYNASFIKRLPFPRSLPRNLSRVGKINQFLSQLYYELTHSFEWDLKSQISLDTFEDQIKFFRDLSNSFVLMHYFPKHRDQYPQICETFQEKGVFPQFSFKYFNPRYDLPAYKVYDSRELTSLIEKINDQYIAFTGNNTLCQEIKQILSSYGFL
ncbi:MAG: N-6 DNA methylase [Promethearchaeia archaeon]